jgi:serine/threonine protein kinase
MSDEPQSSDGLNDDQTFMGQRKESAGNTNSLGADVTRGDATESSKDEFQQVLEAFGEIIDLEKRYDIQGELGAGGMGTVLKAIDKRLGRTVALKFLLEEFGNSAQTLRRFITEAKAIARLNHSNIVQVHEMERSAEGPFIVMEYVEGGSLVDLLEKGPLELEKAVDIICQVCDGLGLAHDQGITHRDIKPANILMTTTGVPKLSDFGLARQVAADHGQTQMGAILGTIDFMPPEQRRDATAVDARSDLWSLAATLYQLVTGRSPKVIRLDQVDASLRPVLAQALEESQDDRYQSTAEFRTALQASLQSTDPGVPAEVELGAGECPACHVKNESSRKFCRSCGASLRVPCLGCDTEIGAWELFCPECGINTRDALAQRRQDLDAQKERIETLRQQYELEQAIELLGPLGAISQPQLTSYLEWGQETLEQCQQQQKDLEQLREQAIEAAGVAYGEFNEKETIRLLEQIPGPFREKPVENAILQCQEQLENIDTLRTQIHDQIKMKVFDGLIKTVLEYLVLRPGDQSADRLLEKLRLSRGDAEIRAFQPSQRKPLSIIFGEFLTPDIIYEVRPGQFKTFEVVPRTLHSISPARESIEMSGWTIPATRASVTVKVKREGKREYWQVHDFKSKEFILEKIQNRDEIENAVAANQPNFTSPVQINYTNYAGEHKTFIAAPNTIQPYPDGIYVMVAPSGLPIYLKKDRIQNWADVEQFGDAGGAAETVAEEEVAEEVAEEEDAAETVQESAGPRSKRPVPRPPPRVADVDGIIAYCQRVDGGE